MSRRLSLRHLAVGALPALLALPADAQGRPPAGPTASAMAPAPMTDTAAVHAQLRGMAQRLFDGMKARDTSALRVLLPPGTALYAVQERNGEAVLRTTPTDAWLKGLVAGPPGDAIEERLFRSEFRADGGLAILWAEYDLWIGPRFSHCGIDQFTFARTADGWRLLSLAYTIQQGARCLTAPRLAPPERSPAG